MEGHYNFPSRENADAKETAINLVFLSSADSAGINRLKLQSWRCKIKITSQNLLTVKRVRNRHPLLFPARWDFPLRFNI